MIHLSQLILDPLSRQVQREFVDPYEMHRTLSHAFPRLSKEEFIKARVLFRVDAEKDAYQLLVQSHEEPDWDAFVAHLDGRRYLLGAPRVKSWAPEFSAGQRLRFRLQANPSFRPFVAKEEKTGKHVERRGLFREYERLDWLLHRGRSEYGFALPGEQVTLRPKLDKDGKLVPLVFRGKPVVDGSGRATDLTLELPAVEVIDLNDGARFPLPGKGRGADNAFSAARFDGVLTVTDADKFAQAVRNGIGPAKGFGFGLLSLARV